MSATHHEPESSAAHSGDLKRRIGEAALFRRRMIVSVLAASLMLQQACYNAIPVTGAATLPRGLVTIQVNERGRLLVGNKLGSLIDKVVGRVVRVDSLNVEVAVETAEDVRGSIARWGGERFTIPREGIGTMNEKKVSRWRTVMLVGGILAGIVLAALAINGTAFSGDDPIDGGITPI